MVAGCSFDLLGLSKMAGTSFSRSSVQYLELFPPIFSVQEREIMGFYWMSLFSLVMRC